MRTVHAKNVLCIDDDPSVLRALKRIFDRAGYITRVVEDGLEALHEIKRDKPDVILLDVMMPAVSGLELCRRIYMDPETRAIPVILVTGRGGEEDFVAGLDCGAVDYVAKPWNEKILLARVRAALRGKLMAEELLAANRNLEEFSRIVAHDVRAPMANLRMLVSRVQKLAGNAAGSAKANECLAQMADVADKAVSMVNHLLDYARQRNQHSEFGMVELGEVVRETILSHCSAIAAAHAEVSVEENLPCVYGDRVQLAQVFSNLLGNALKYAAPGRKPKIQIGVEAAQENAVVWVRDNGMGIPAQWTDSVFDPFVRASNASAFAGSGLGLSIVKKIAERHGGRAWVESVEGEGSVFYVELPCGQFEEAGEPAAMPLESEPAMLPAPDLQMQAAAAQTQVLPPPSAADSARMLQSDKMAAIGQLAAGIAHEINNPVGYIQSNLNTLAGYCADIHEILQAVEWLEGAVGRDGSAAARAAAEQVRQIKHRVDYAAMIEDSRQLIDDSLEGVRRVVEIVKNLKDFAHSEKGELEWAGLQDMAESSLKLVWNELKYKTEVVRRYEPVPMIYCYPRLIKQLMVNLLVNAAQAIEKHGVITVRVWQEGERIKFSVSDTGCGIPPENLSRIFDPFFTTKAVGAGTGLGLHVVATIMQNHQGVVEVHSEPGKGATFVVSFYEDFSMLRKNIIVAGASPEMDAVVEIIGRDGRFLATQRLNAGETCSAIREKPPTLVIVEDTLSHLGDVVGAVTALREQGVDIGLMVLISAGAQSACPVDFSKPGNTLVEKPVTEGGLLGCISTVLGKRHALDGVTRLVK